MKRNVLIASGDRGIVESLEAAFRRGPYRAIAAGSAAEALVSVEHNAIAAVIADEMLADVSGAELLNIVAKDRPDAMRVLLVGDPASDPNVALMWTGDVHRVLSRTADAAEIARTIRASLPDVETGAEKPSAEALDPSLAPVNTKVMADLERTYPGITAVRRDRDGSVVIDTGNIRIDSVTEDIRAQLEALAG